MAHPDTTEHQSKQASGARKAESLGQEVGDNQGIKPGFDYGEEVADNDDLRDVTAETARAKKRAKAENKALRGQEERHPLEQEVSADGAAKRITKENITPLEMLRYKPTADHDSDSDDDREDPGQRLSSWAYGINRKGPRDALLAVGGAIHKAVKTVKKVVGKTAEEGEERYASSEEEDPAAAIFKKAEGDRNKPLKKVSGRTSEYDVEEYIARGRAFESGTGPVAAMGSSTTTTGRVASAGASAAEPMAGFDLSPVPGSGRTPSASAPVPGSGRVPSASPGAKGTPPLPRATASAAEPESMAEFNLAPVPAPPKAPSPFPKKQVATTLDPNAASQGAHASK